MIYESKRNQRGFKNYVVESIEDYIELVTRLYVEGKEYWFRGQNDEAYRLVPTGLRELYAIQDSRGNRFDKPIKDNACSGSNNIVASLPINEMVEAFSIEAREYVEYDVNNQIEWECIAQHYGLPTRLLDWTTNALDALYFAVSDCALKDDDGCYDSFLESGFGGQGGVVFVIDPLEINRETVPFRDGKKSFVFDVNNDKEMISYFLNECLPPVCISGINKEKRICRQSGNFTTTGKLTYAFDFYQVLQEKIIKILIPFSCFEKIRFQLNALGINHSAIYVNEDEKDVIAKKIAEKTKKSFYDSLFEKERLS